MREDLARRLSQIDDPGMAASVIAEWAAANAGSELFNAALYVPMVKADMAGQLMVRGLEADQVEFAESTSDVLVGMELDAAINEFLRRGAMNEGDLFRLIAGYRARASKSQDLMIKALAKRVAEALERSLNEGLTLREFASLVNDGSANLGLEPATHAYLENVFRTNIQTSYGAGRFRQMTHPDVVAARPYVEYRTAGDSRVRNSHAALRGLLFRADSQVWHAIAPPNGFQCRCSFISRAAEDVDSKKVLDELPQGTLIDSRFSRPPVDIIGG